MQMPALTLQDYRRLAQERMERPVWDFFEGGAGEEHTLAANERAFDRVRLRPTVLRPAAGPDTTCKILGRTWAAPIGVAPMAFHTLAHPDGELATVRAAAARGLPVTVSTFAGRACEELAAAAAGAPLWLQLYCFRDRSVTRRLIERAERAGAEALVLTVDAPRLGRRLRDVRNDFRLPPHIVPANLDGGGFSSPAAHARAELDPSLDWSAVPWLRSVTSLPVLVKGVLTAPDALRAVEAGVDGIIVSNHGGRQLDGVLSSARALPAIADAVKGQIKILADSGIRNGLDVVRAIALGADCAMIGRAYIYALAAAGEAGVKHLLELLEKEMRVAMTLTSVAKVADITGELLAS